MRFSRGAALAALATCALALAGAPALARAEDPGGAQAPAAPKAGGIQYGLATRPLGRLVISSLHVPRSGIAGRPPRVTLRLDEKGVGTVYLQVRIISLSTHHTAVLADIGWSHTGRTLAVRWPSAASLAAGVYQVSVSAHDHQGANLQRLAHSSGRATLTINSPAPTPTPPPTPSPTPVPVIEAGVPTPAQTAAAGAVFPVAGAHNFGGPENRFGAPRAGHIHEGQDILTSEGTPVLAPMAGVVESTSYQAGGAGYYVFEHTGATFDLFFAHCMAGSFAVHAGQGVSAGQQLCRAGQTGDATTPHLHFEMWVGGWHAPGSHPIDPLPYLQAWDRSGPSA